eukprot:CAMPEP_0204515152 /NCGR_PEP_ID=MMETSP0661-20131031/2467_1 /ASSEMBLY_ACC=CAM_ASM_000606 /TAXON_ID=109239 /ORGANISM="Alexandrium margalefi, Strain AMGDE01CS-322" /LENGTH=108 /DNA_ID=CAMNT_0051520451 /DNA_START=20 /DNA_END=343 /DNA_ORIENTATION=-
MTVCRIDHANHTAESLKTPASRSQATPQPAGLPPEWRAGCSNPRGLPQYDGQDERGQRREEDEDVEERLLAARHVHAALHQHLLAAAALAASGAALAAAAAAAAAWRR